MRRLVTDRFPIPILFLFFFVFSCENIKQKSIAKTKIGFKNDLSGKNQRMFQL